MMPGYGKSNNGNKGAWYWEFGVGGEPEERTAEE